MFDWLINWLFKNWDNYNWIDSNYYNDIHKFLTREEILKIVEMFRKDKNHVVKKFIKVDWEKYQINIKHLRWQCNNWNISVLIESTNHYRKVKKAFHWVYKENCWSTKDYWVYEFTYLWKNEDWFDSYRQSDTEKCYLWHWSKKNLI